MNNLFEKVLLVVTCASLAVIVANKFLSQPYYKKVEQMNTAFCLLTIYNLIYLTYLFIE